MGHWTKALRAIATETTSDSRRDFRFTKEWLSFGLAYEDRLKAPMVQLFSLFPAAEGLPIDMGVVAYRTSNINPFELFVVKALATLTEPKRVFEFGTFDGATALELARSAPGAEVLTLDLPESLASPVVSENENLKGGGVGRCFAGTPEEARITQLRGDSRQFDFSPYFGTVDLILVDAGHEYEVVKADTATALKLAAPGATVVWHDYSPGWPGVVRAIDELVGYDAHHIAGTDFAVVRVPSAPVA
jgi:predicted O-methyltransferase YrrM